MKNYLLELSPVEYSASAIKILQFDVEPNSLCIPLHWHDRMELLRINSGKLCVECSTDTHILSDGELILIPPKALHKGYTVDVSVKYDVIMFDVRSFYNETEICKRLLPAIFDGRAIFNRVATNTETLNCIDTICRSYDSGSLEMTANIYKLLGFLFKNELVEIRSQPKNNSVKRIADYIEENYAKEINNDNLCEKFGYTAEHLCRKFKKSTGLTPMAYLKIFRLETARRCLKNRDESIGTVATECGFSDANYFTRCFKKHFGVPPSHYKK